MCSASRCTHSLFRFLLMLAYLKAEQVHESARYRTRTAVQSGDVAICKMQTPPHCKAMLEQTLSIYLDCHPRWRRWSCGLQFAAESGSLGALKMLACSRRFPGLPWLPLPLSACHGKRKTQCTKTYSDHLFYIPDRPPAAPDTFSAAPPVELGHFLYQGLPSD